MDTKKSDDRTNRPDLVRIPTGIPGLDEMIEGGFPFPSVVLVSGPAGTGKTTFALKYLCEGAKKGEQGLYFTTLSEPTQWMLRFATQFAYVNKKHFGKQIIFCDMGSIIRNGDPEEMLAFIDAKVAEIMPQRI